MAPPVQKTRRLLNGTDLVYFRGTFYRGTSAAGEIAAMLGSPFGRLISGRALAGLPVPDLADMSAEEIRDALVTRESFEMARGTNISSHFIPLSVKATTSKGFGSTFGGGTFEFDIDFIPYSMSLADSFLPGVRTFVQQYVNMPRDIFPLFLGNPSENEFFAYTGTAIFGVKRA